MNVWLLHRQADWVEVVGDDASRSSQNALYGVLKVSVMIWSSVAVRGVERLLEGHVMTLERR